MQYSISNLNIFIILLAIGWTEFSCPVGYIPTLQNFVYIFILIFPKLYWKNNLVYLPITQYNLWQIRSYYTSPILRCYYSIVAAPRRPVTRFVIFRQSSFRPYFISTRFYSASTKKVAEMRSSDSPAVNPWDVTGFTDGEGCFHVSVIEDKKFKSWWHVRLGFSIGLHVREKPLLYDIKKTLGVGHVSRQGPDAVQLRVQSIKDLEIVINHFDKFPLLTKKKGDLHALKLVLIIMKNKEHLTIDGIRQIVALKASMNRGLSEKLLAAFPDVVAVERPLVENAKIPDPNWLAGFTSAEGCFYVRISVSKTHSVGFRVELVFLLAQHSRDENLIRSIPVYLNCGTSIKRENAFDYRVRKFSDIAEKIIPFFKKYPIRGVKALDFEDFCRVAEMMKQKKHLTFEGLEEIRKIKAGMNTGRKWN